MKAALIIVSKLSFSYVICISASGRSFTRVLESHHAEVAAEAAIVAWKYYRDFHGGVCVNLPPEVIEAVIAILGSVPWT